MDDWQPIETAPRDGSWFVICRAGEDDFYEAGCYDVLTFPKYVEAGDGLYRKVMEPIYEWRGFDNFHRATHWTRLPKVPPA